MDGDNNGSNSGEFHRSVPIDMATRYPDKVVFTNHPGLPDLYPPDKPQLISDDGTVKRYQRGESFTSRTAPGGRQPGRSRILQMDRLCGLSVFTAKNNSWRH